MRALCLTLIGLLASPALQAQNPKKESRAAADAFAVADQKLNATYQQVLRQYSQNPVFLKNLRAAQRLWLPFRDAQVAMKYPDREPGFYGSVLPMCKARYLADLTDARTQQLAEWLNPQIEGDVCAGTLQEADPE